MIAEQQKLIKQKIDLECPICTEQYHTQLRHPFIICMSQHHVCLPCIRNILFKNKAPNQPAQCPMCKTPIYQQKIAKFRFFSDVKDVKQIVTQIKLRQTKLKTDIMQIQKKKNGTLQDLKQQKTKNDILQHQLNLSNKINQQIKTNQSYMQMDLKKSQRINYVQEQKIGQKNKIIISLIGMCESLISKVPNENNQQMMSKVKKLREEIQIEEKETFIKSRYNNPEKAMNNIDNLLCLRTIIGISAKITMKKPLELLKTVIVEAFDRINEFITKKDLFVKFELKIMLYRNYNKMFDQLFEETDFESKSQKIKTFLSKADGDGQWQTQAIEVMLQKANKLPNIDQLFLIADSQANSEKKTQTKRQFLGEKYWNRYGYPKTNFQAQLNKAKDKYPIHTIYLDKADFFKRVSAETKGDSKYFDIQNLEENDLIKQFICDRTFTLLQKKVQNGNVKI